ncbi:MAG: NAD(+)/NADH kinase [Phycisphaeraceae bacterium]|nr:NAD(+)/NADH kinase [Phycisphaeraceae bacterium]MCW5763232.1 NAD(+)/NADH kinase [Phycisphaeraceae bacterium]
MSRSVLVIVNRTKPDAAAALESVLALVRAHGRVASVLATGSDEPLPSSSEVDLVVVLGGDGSLLSAVRRCLPLGKPMLGVNLGRVGFMAGFEMTTLSQHAASLFGDAPLPLRQLPMLGASVTSAGEREPRFEAIAANEFVVTAGPPFRMISLALSIDGEPGPAVSGDGLIVSSPMGSTAYNVSAGGPIVVPGVEGVCITPIAAHSLSFRPIVVPTSSRIELRMDRVNDSDEGGTTLVADGQRPHRIHAGDRVEFRSTHQQVQLVIDPDVSYWQTLLGKMHWAAAPKERTR